MPRPYKKNNPLRKIRDAAGLTQSEFGRLVGVSKETIEKVENERLAMSGDLALKVMRQTGCSLTSGASGGYAIAARCGYTLEPYEQHHFEAHRQAMTGVDEENLPHHLAAANGAVELLLRAADRNGKLASLVADLEAFLSERFHRFALGPQLDGLLKDEFSPKPGVEANIARDYALIPLSAGFQFYHEFEPVEKNRAGTKGVKTAHGNRKNRKAAHFVSA